MSGYRNKLLIKLSQNNVQHYNNSNCATMVSQLLLNCDLQKETETNTDRPSLCVPYDDRIVSCIDSRVIGPLIPISESEYCPSFCEEIGEGNYTELLTVDVVAPSISQCLQVPESVPNNLDNHPELPVSHDFVTVTTKAIIEHQPYCHNTVIPTTNIRKPRATSDIDYDKIVPMIEDNCVRSMKRSITSNEKPNDIENQEQIEILLPKKSKRLRDPKDILENQKKKHPMKPPCSNCKKSCSEHIDELKRKEIHKQFWSMDRQRRRDFLSRQVEKLPTAIKTAGSNSRRRNTLVWTLNELKVCKRFFLSTLGYTNDEAVQAVLKANYMSRNPHPKIGAAPDPRGHHPSSTAFSTNYQQEIRNFILKYKPVHSHYNIQHAPNRRYLPMGVTFSSIYNDFKRYCQEKSMQKCSWTHFHKMIKEMNISTAEPVHDICTRCKNHETAHKTMPLPCNCEDCIDLGQHLEKKRNSRRDLKLVEEKCEKSGGKESVYTVDMQKAIQMPLLTTKEFYFSRKLVLFNESFVPPGKNKTAVCILWHEGESGRKAYNVATTYAFFLKNYCRDQKHVYFFLDNCNAQNKNKVLISALVRLINDKTTEIETVTLEYFESGHTFMAADTVHAAITKKFKMAGEIYDFDDFVHNIKTSRKNMEVAVLTHKDMIIFSNDSKPAYPKGYNIHNLKVIEFRRGHLSIFAKNDYDGDFKEIHFLKRKEAQKLSDEIANGKTDLLQSLAREGEARGISEIKKGELLLLCKSMPSTRSIFYKNLVVSSEPDLDEYNDEPND